MEILRHLLAENGTAWVFVDDNEAHYLKVLMDEVFGRANHVQTIIWQRKASPANDAKWISNDHDFILLYAKAKERWRPNRLARSEEQDAYYTNPDDDPRGPWNSVTYTNNKSKVERPNLWYAITNPNTGKKVWPPSETVSWRCKPETHAENEKANLLYWGKNGDAKVPRLKRFLSDAKPVVPRSVWLHDEVGHTSSAMLESKVLFDEPFATPKPEAVVARIIEIASSEADWVLDSFAGSGTTGAVAHKMGRRWIMVELGEHCHTHIIPRLRKVIDGTDPGGVTEATGWKGGGGFRYFRLAPSLLEKDGFGNWVVSKQYNAAMLAEAMCKLEGFTYAPSDAVYWQQGHSTERDFIFTTTQTLSREQLQKLSDEVGEGRSLLVCCGAHRAKKLDEFPNLTVKKIPKMVLNRCEWGHDDYSLEIKNLPMKAPDPEPAEPAAKKKTENTAQGNLFGVKKPAGGGK